MDDMEHVGWELHQASSFGEDMRAENDPTDVQQMHAPSAWRCTNPALIVTTDEGPRSCSGVGLLGR